MSYQDGGVRPLSDQYLIDAFAMDPALVTLVRQCEEALQADFAEAAERATYNQYKVLQAFQQHRVSDSHFNWHTGYGYDDPGREVLEKVYASVFHTEKALVRTQIVNGTHALALALMGTLRPGDELIYCTGGPYDTLEEVIGIRGSGMGSLAEYGITYRQVALTPEGKLDLEAISAALGPRTRMVCFQRATGYAWRRAISVDEIGQAVQKVKERRPDILCMVDNCYGEFLDTKEPTDVGVDIMAGSLIKNPGGGIALSGGYVVGKGALIDQVAYRLTCPGIGGECGLTFGQTRTMLQGLFLAPHTVCGAIQGAMLCGKVYEQLGYPVCPRPEDLRSDIIQAIELGSAEAVVAFCQGIQGAAPVDAFVSPEPWNMPGYEDPVVMAAGAFVQGSSIELSADGPIRPPYIVYFQGGLTYDHARLGVLKSLSALQKEGLLHGEKR